MGLSCYLSLLELGFPKDRWACQSVSVFLSPPPTKDVEAHLRWILNDLSRKVNWERVCNHPLHVSTFQIILRSNNNLIGIHERNSFTAVNVIQQAVEI